MLVPASALGSRFASIEILESSPDLLIRETLDRESAR